MILKRAVFSLLILSVYAKTHAQRLAGDDRVREIYAMIDADTAKWIYGAGIGLDMRSLLLINPRVGTGRSQIGFGILAGGLAKYKSGKWLWNNNASIQLAAQKIGLGTEEPWQKNMDIFRIISKLSYDFDDKRWSTAIDFTFQSILLPTYRNSFLRPKDENDKLTATFFSPATLNFSPGIGYKPNDKFTFLGAPASFKGIFIASQSVANLNIHGTQPIKNEEGEIIRYSKVDLRFGFFLRSSYTQKFLEDNLHITSTLDLFSNYLRSPENLEVFWRTEVGYKLWKNIFIQLNTDIFYDQNVLVQIDKDGNLGLRTSITNALYIKYNYRF
jgi:hypothetical protein